MCDCDDSDQWRSGYVQGRRDAAEDISNMRDVDEGCMKEIEEDPLLDETYILVRRVDAQEVANGGVGEKDE